MKKIKTAEEYIWKVYEGEIPITGLAPTKCMEAIKQAQLDMLKYAVNKVLENAEPYIYNDLHYNEGKQEILKTIDEIKKELE